MKLNALLLKNVSIFLLHWGPSSVNSRYTNLGYSGSVFNFLWKIGLREDKQLQLFFFKKVGSTD